MVILQDPAGSLLADDVENAAYAGCWVGFHRDWRKLGFEMVERGRKVETGNARKAVRGIDREMARIDIILQSLYPGKMQSSM